MAILSPTKKYSSKNRIIVKRAIEGKKITDNTNPGNDLNL